MNKDTTIKLLVALLIIFSLGAGFHVFVQMPAMMKDCKQEAVTN